MPFTLDDVITNEQSNNEQFSTILKSDDIGRIGQVMRYNADIIKRIIKKIKPDWDGKIYCYDRYIKMSCPKHPPDKDPSLSFHYKQGVLWAFDWHAEKYNDLVSMPIEDWVRSMTKDPEILLLVKAIPRFTYDKEADTEWELQSIVQEVVSTRYIRFDGSYDAISGSFYFLAGIRTDYDIDIGREIISSLSTYVVQAFNKHHLQPPSDYKLKQHLRNTITIMTGETISENAVRNYYNMHKRAMKECSTGWGQSIPFKDKEILICENEKGDVVEIKEVPRDPAYVYFHTIPYSLDELQKMALPREEIIRQFDEITGGAGPFLFDEMARLLTPGIRRIIPINIGVPKAGKSFLAELLKTMLGDKRVAIGLSTNKAFTLQGTLGKVVIFLDEFVATESNTALIKLLSGGDEVVIENKYEPIIRIPNPYRLVININYISQPLNNAMNLDDALRSRAYFIPFFVRHAIKDISATEAYRYIPELVKRGIELLSSKPMYGLDWESATNIFGVRGEKDPERDDGNILKEFVDNEIERDDNTFTRSIDIYYNYVKYALVRGKRPLGIMNSFDYIATFLRDRDAKDKYGYRGYKVKVVYDWEKEFEIKFTDKQKAEIDDIEPFGK